MQIDRELPFARPDLCNDIKAEAKLIITRCEYVDKILQLRKYCDWSLFSWPVMAQMANAVDMPFIKLMLSLAKHNYKYSAISMHMWWRRLKAVDQQHLITYFSYVNFEIPKGNRVEWSDVYKQCCRTQETFQQYSSLYDNNKTVEIRLRTLLGISMQTDIRQAWLEWVKHNHPDKGGRADVFILTKAAYEEYQNVNSKTQSQ